LANFILNSINIQSIYHREYSEYHMVSN